jgi:radical SAM protein with 4Fe4S-binding SPASM domain
MDEPFRLSEIKLELTYRCSLACVHCSSDAGPDSPLEMTREDCVRILEQAMAIGADHVTFSGGEPLLWDGLDEVVRLAASAKMDTSIYTSGYSPSFAERAEHLAESGLRAIIFSLHGATDASHDRITRVQGSYDQTRRAIQSAVDCGLNAELHFVPLSDNFRELEEIAATARTWGINRVSVLRLVPQGRACLMRNCALNRLENLQLKRMIERLRLQGFDVRTGSPYNFLMLNDQPKCSAGIDRLIVGPDLRIYPCDAFKQVRAEELMGDAKLSVLGGDSLLECWYGSSFLTAVRNHLAAPFEEPCLSCNALSECLSGCLAQKVIEYGALVKKPDPMCLIARKEGKR